MKTLAKIMLSAAAISLTMLTACRHKETVIANADDSAKTETVRAVVSPIGGAPAKALPRAVIYKTNGNYSQYVMARMNADHTQFTYFPAPSDITPQSTPLPYGDGWLVDRQGGVGPGTVFLNYTYGQYAALGQVPPLPELKRHVIHGAKVTEYRVLPQTLNALLDSLQVSGK